MGLKVNESNYRITVNIDVPGEKKGTFQTVDIVHYTIIRAPLAKPIPIATIVLDLAPRFHLNILEKIQKNIFPVCTVTVEFGDNNSHDSSNDRMSSLKNLVNKNIYKIIDVQDLENLPADLAKLKRIKLVMIDSLLHWLGHSNGFNLTLRDLTAYDAIKKYEGYLISEFGSGTFDPPKHLICSESSYKYQRIQIKSSNDLMVPQLIIFNKKPLVNFCYYFLDNFRSLKETKKRILPLFVDFDCLSKFQPYDIMANGHEDTAMNYIITKKTIVDKTDRFVRKGDYAYLLKDKNGRFQRYIPTNPVTVPEYISNDTVAFHADPHQGGRGGDREEYHPITHTEIGKQKPPKESETIYCPDDFKSGKARCDANKNIVRNVIESFDTFNFPQIQPNAIEFQRKYNLDKYAPGSYLYIPLQITNQFKKINMVEARYNHSAIVQFIKYS